MEQKLKAEELHGAFVITRRYSGYKTWTWGDDVPMLIGLYKSKEAALKAAKEEAEQILKLAKFTANKTPCRTGYTSKVVPVDEPLKQIEWNDCVGYFEHYISPYS